MGSICYFHTLDVGLKHLHIDFTSFLDEAIQRQRKLSKSNGLLHLKSQQLIQAQTSHPAKGKALKILQFHQKYHSQYGINPTLEVKKILHWFDPNKESHYVSPIFCRNILCTKKRDIHSNIRFSSVGDWFVNPILMRYFESQFGISLTTEQALTEIESACERNNIILDKGATIDTCDKAWVIEDQHLLGNFNYSSLYFEKDLESINNCQHQLPNQSHLEETNLPFHFITDYDISQSAFCKNVLGGQDAVLQGPPGTGKSQTITNLIASYATAGKKVLFVSAKKAAIEVIRENLKKQHLDPLVLQSIQPNGSFYDLYSSFRETYENWDNWVPERPNFDQEYELYEANIRNFISAYSTFQEDLEMSLYEAEQKIDPTQLGTINNYLPSYKKWLSIKHNFQSLQKIENHKLWFVLSDHFVKENSNIDKWLRKVELIASKRKVLDVVSKTLDSEEITFETLQKYSVLAYSLDHISTTTIKFILSNKTKKKQLEKSLRKLKSIAVYQADDDNFYAKWKTFPNRLQFSSFRKQFQQLKELKGWSFKKRKLKKSVQQFLNSYKDSEVEANLLLDRLDEWYQREQEKKEVLAFCLETFDIDLSETYIVQQLQKLLKNIDENQFFFTQLKSSGSLIKTLEWIKSNQREIDELKLALRYLFINPFELSLVSIFNWSQSVSNQQKEIIEQKSVLFNVTDSLNASEKMELYKINEDVDQKVFENSYLKCRSEYSIVKHHDFYWLRKNLEQLSHKKSKAIKANCKALLTLYQNNTHRMNQIILKSNTKLSPEQKKRKKQLKEEKKIFLKEVYKKRQHIGLKNLIEKAPSFVFNYHPIHLLSPESLAANIPLQEDLYDIIIFDEASQIPVDHALSGIYRSQQLIVVGDPEQMPPTQFFEKEEDQSESLLEISFKHLTRHLLRWHYRSKNPDLIAFSNQYFYDNKLKVFPKNSAIQSFQFIEINGVYENQCNEKEAEAIVRWLKKNEEITKGKTIGVVAFSKKQAECIAKHTEKLNDQIQVYNLESVQGDENDFILISTGYGYNADGKFSSNFGPINSSGGPQRLNVLFSRAKECVVVFNSIPLEKIATSTNEGVTILYKYLKWVQSRSLEQHLPVTEKIVFKTDDLMSQKKDDVVSNILGLKKLGFDLKFEA